MKTISVKDSVWQELTRLKADLMHSDLSQTISYLFYEMEKRGDEKS